MAAAQDVQIILCGDKLEARVLEIKTHGTNKLTNAPVQTGVNLNDHKVRQPIRITIKVAIDINEDGWQKAVDLIYAAYNNMELGKLAKIFTRHRTFVNMDLITLPCFENVESYDVFTFDLEFQEIIFNVKNADTSTIASPSNPEDSSSYARGAK